MLKSLAQMLLGLVSLLAIPALADEQPFLFGGDAFISGNHLQVAMPVANDLFAMGYKLKLNQPVDGDVHAGGFALDLSQTIGGNVYVMGNDIEISGKVGADVSAAGNSISISGADGVSGNVRLAGANVMISAPVAGAAMIAAREATLNGMVHGDFSFSGDQLNFGDQARVVGEVTIHSSSDISVPASVASADRVHFVKTEASMPVDDDSHKFAPERHIWWAPLFMVVVLLILGFAWLALFPSRSRIAYETAMARTGTSVLTGIGSLSALIGVIPVLAISFVGILVIPFAIVFLVLGVLIGYVAGAWFIGLRVMAMFGGEVQSSRTRSIALLVGVIGGMVLCFVPFIGWLVQLGIVIFGLGGICLAAMQRWGGHASMGTPVETPKA